MEMIVLLTFAMNDYLSQSKYFIMIIEAKK